MRLPFENKNKREHELLRAWRNLMTVPSEFPAWEFNAYMKLAECLRNLRNIEDKSVEERISGETIPAFLSLRRTYEITMARMGGVEGMRKQVDQLVQHEAALRGKKEAVMNMAHWGDSRYIGTSLNTNRAAADFFGVSTVHELVENALGISPGEKWQEKMRTPATAHEVESALNAYVPPTERAKPVQQNAPSDQERQSKIPRAAEMQRFNAEQLREQKESEPGQER